MKDTLEQLAAEVTAANDDLNLGNHDNDLQRLRELESDREDLIERINAREYRLHVARTALLSFMSPEAQPEQSAPVAAPEPDWPIGTYEAVPGSLVYNQAEARLNDDTPFEGCEPSAEDRAAESFRRVWAVKAEPDEQPDTEPDHIPTKRSG